MTVARSKIFIVDDHPLVREWLINLIDQTPDLMVCGEAANAETALSMLSTSNADLAIVESASNGLSGTAPNGSVTVRNVTVISPHTGVGFLFLLSAGLVVAAVPIALWYWWQGGSRESKGTRGAGRRGGPRHRFVGSGGRQVHAEP